MAFTMAGFCALCILVLFAGLVLALIVLVLKSKVLDNPHPRRLLMSTMQSDPSVNSRSSCQTCHVCGGLRLRTQNQARYDPPKDSKSQGNHLDKPMSVQCRPIQHKWVEISTQALRYIKQAVRKLINYHKKRVHVEFLKLTRLMKPRKQRSERCLSKGCVVPPPDASFNWSSSTTLATSTDGTVISSIDSALKNGSDNVLVPQGTQKSSGTDLSEGSFQRVILEFLVSRCNSHNNNSHTFNPYITSTLQMGATLGRLAGCKDPVENKGTKSSVYSHDTLQLLPGAMDSIPDVSGSGYANDDQISEMLNQLLNKANLSPKGEIQLSDYDTSKIGIKDCTQHCRVLGENMDAGSSDSSVSTGSLTHSAHPKPNTTDCFRGTAMSDVSIKDTVEKKDALEMALRSPLNNVGSLSVSFLNLIEQEENPDVKGQAESVLASLNVAENLYCGTNSRSDRLSNKACGHVNTNTSQLSIFTREQETDDSLMKEAGQISLPSSTDKFFIDDRSSFPKRIKKKKKMKGKKPKATGDFSLVDDKERQEIGRVALEVAKHVTPVPEREHDCVCGAMKGRHNDSCSFPFTCSGSRVQRKLQEQYNQLVRSNAAKTLTLAQVGQFASCLVEAKFTLQQKSEMIQRKYAIAKSLLSKADKSSFDRLQSQIYGIEMEQKKLEEDTIVYNHLQAQLKLSPAYQKMLEYGRAHFEFQPKSGQVIEKLQPEDVEISFEEFLEQEKKDVFWQRRNLSGSALPSR